MAVALTDLKEYVGVTSTSKDALLTDCLEDATALLNKYMGSAVVPTNIVDRCTLMVAYDLYERRNAPNGIVNTQFQGADGQPATARIARDPLQGVYPILSRWVLPW